MSPVSIGFVIERKVVMKKIRAMKEDKKTDPEVLLKQETLLLDIDQKKAVVTVACARLKPMLTIPLEKFQDPAFDYMGCHRENIAHRKELLSAAKK